MSNKVTEQVWKATGLKRNRLVIMLILADFSDHAGLSSPLIAEVATRARLSERQVQRYLRALEHEGWVERFAQNIGRGRPFTYRLFPEKGDGFAPERVTVSYEKGDTFAGNSIQMGDTFGMAAGSDLSSPVTRAQDQIINTRSLPLSKERRDLYDLDRTKKEEGSKSVGKERESEREERTETDGRTDFFLKDSKWSEALRLWHRNIGKLNDVVEEALSLLATQYGCDLLCRAIREAVLNNKFASGPTVGFVKAICERLASEDRASKLGNGAIVTNTGAYTDVVLKTNPYARFTKD